MLHFTVPENKFDESQAPERRDDVFCDESHRYEVAVAFSGKNIGFGSIKSGRNWIRSFGLHFYPLGQMENYGMDRDYGSVKDIKIVQEAGRYSITGWTRLARGEIWAELELVRSSEIDLYFRIENFGEVVPMALAFFISADAIHVGDQEFRSGTLSRYKGVAEALTCYSGSEKLQIIPTTSTPMQIIPLAGKNHFWGAGFLVAIEMAEFGSRFHVKVI